MVNKNILSASFQILEKTKQLGAALAGFALENDLRTCPSSVFVRRMRSIGKSDTTRNMESGRRDAAGVNTLNPRKSGSVLVIAVEHPADQPEMDWWHGRWESPGNRILAGIVEQLCVWITETYGIGTSHLPYHPQGRGTYLKDAAVLAGLGCIGRNNLLVTPEYGPRVRLRALTLDAVVPSTGITGFDPCASCEGMPCRRACPASAFDHQLYTANEYRPAQLPGRDGSFSRPVCNSQMGKDMTAAETQIIEGLDAPVKVIRYCRECELACPAGK